MKIKKEIMITFLVTIVFIMAVGYAAFSQLLTINGSAEITSSWNVHIKSIEVKESSSGATSEKAEVSQDRYSADFDVTLTSPGDYVTYTVTVENTGTINAKVANAGIVFSGLDQMNLYNDKDQNNPNGQATKAIVFTYEGLSIGDKLPFASGNNTDTFTVTALYNPAISSQPSDSELNSSVKMTINYIQDK